MKSDMHAALRSETLSIVVPVFNDWASFRVLLERLNEIASRVPVSIFVIGVNDGSTEKADAEMKGLVLESLRGLEIVHLRSNVGHQRAIAIGLCVEVEEYGNDMVMVMDADGEDPPAAIPVLLATAAGREDFCIVAQRRRRTESLSFRASYLLYKGVFRLLTGKKINFGNFSLTSKSYAKRLVMTPDLWNNLAAALLRSRMPIDMVPVDRGTRYAGKSKMNFVSLIAHGMSGISVYADTIFVRLLLVTLFFVATAVVSIPLLLILRLFFPTYATPGWATTVAFGLIIIFLQLLSTTLSSVLMLLNSRVQRSVLPLLDYKVFIEQREFVQGAGTGQRQASAL